MNYTQMYIAAARRAHHAGQHARARSLLLLARASLRRAEGRYASASHNGSMGLAHIIRRAAMQRGEPMQFGDALRAAWHAVRD